MVAIVPKPATNVAAAILDKYASKQTTLLASDDVHALSRVTEFVPSGCLPLDIVMGGGAPVGRLIEIYGDNSTGKSVLGEQFIAHTQAMGGTGVLIDSEVALSDEIAQAIGIDRHTMLYSTPETIEDVWDIIVNAIEAKDEIDPGGLMTIVWDSVAGTSSRAELERVRREGLNTNTMAVHARLLSQMGRMLPSLISKKRIALVLINQTRENIGVMFGDDKTTSGGRSIGYYATIRIELSGAGKIATAEKVVTGINVKAVVTKNKVAPPFGRCVFPILFGHGIDEPGAIFEWLKVTGLMITGTWNKLDLGGTEVRFQRKDWAKTLAEHDQAIRQLIVGHAGFAYEVEEEEV